MKKLLTLAFSFLAISAHADRAVYFGFETKSFDRRACDNDWHTAHDELKRVLESNGFDLHGANSCTRYAVNPDMDTGFALSYVFEGSDAEVARFESIMRGQRFDGEHIRFEYALERVESMHYTYYLIKWGALGNGQTPLLFEKAFPLLQDEETFLMPYRENGITSLVELIEDEAPAKLELVQKFLSGVDDTYNLVLASEVSAKLASRAEPLVLFGRFRGISTK
ncbi:MAG TPA: hypothetical protein VM901_06445 [Bdellovibrionota bacterium]|jgi:hypothetical protein|nr:hypothetical protein [Bdellovibrionota bacterium]